MQPNRVTTGCIKIEPFDKGKFWFSWLNQDGGTEKHPYGAFTRDELQALADKINEALKQNT